MKEDIKQYFDDLELWKKELLQLREILLGCNLDEQLKWRSPCFSFQGKNIGIIGPLKEYCTLGFYKGTLLKDPAGLLQLPGPNTRSARVLTFTSTDEIESKKEAIIDLIEQAIELERKGVKFNFEEKPEQEVPQELLDAFEEDFEFKVAFDKLTPGRQRGYLLFFNSAKKPETRVNRINKFREKIKLGKGMNEW